MQIESVSKTRSLDASVRKVSTESQRRRHTASLVLATQSSAVIYFKKNYDIVQYENTAEFCSAATICASKVENSFKYPCDKQNKTKQNRQALLEAFRFPFLRFFSIVFRLCYETTTNNNRKKNVLQGEFVSFRCFWQAR